MRVINSTDWTDEFLKQMLRWVCFELEMPVRALKIAKFRNSRSAWGGVARAWKSQITVCVGKARLFPIEFGSAHYCPGEVFSDRVECLIAVTAHEAYHVAASNVKEHQQRTRRGRESFSSSERATCAAELRVLKSFRNQRETLLAKWSIPVETPILRISPQAEKSMKATRLLQRWERKMKFAANKVRKYRRQVAYYEKALAKAAIPSK